MVIGILAITLSVLPSWVQLSKALRQRTTSGISPSGLALAVALTYAWLIYAIRMHDLTQICAYALILVAWLALFRASLRWNGGGVSPKRLLVLGALLVGATVAGASRDVAVCGTVATALSLVSQLPQALLARRSTGRTAVSPMAYAVSAISCALWIAHGMRLADWFLVATSGWALLVCSYISIRSALSGVRTHRPAPVLALNNVTAGVALRRGAAA